MPYIVKFRTILFLTILLHGLILAESFSLIMNHTLEVVMEIELDRGCHGDQIRQVFMEIELDRGCHVDQLDRGCHGAQIRQAFIKDTFLFTWSLYTGFKLMWDPDKTGVLGCHGYQIREGGISRWIPCLHGHYVQVFGCHGAQAIEQWFAFLNNHKDGDKAKLLIMVLKIDKKYIGSALGDHIPEMIIHKTTTIHVNITYKKKIERKEEEEQWSMCSKFFHGLPDFRKKIILNICIECNKDKGFTGSSVQFSFFFFHMFNIKLELYACISCCWHNGVYYSVEKDFEFIDNDIKLKKRSVDNTLSDDEDALQSDGSAEGSGTETAENTVHKSMIKVVEFVEFRQFLVITCDKEWDLNTCQPKDSKILFLFYPKSIMLRFYGKCRSHQQQKILVCTHVQLYTDLKTKVLGQHGVIMLGLRRILEPMYLSALGQHGPNSIGSCGKDLYLNYDILDDYIFCCRSARSCNGSPSCQCSRPPSHQSSRTPRCQFSRPPSHQSSSPPSHQCSRPPSHQCSRLPSHQYSSPLATNNLVHIAANNFSVEMSILDKDLIWPIKYKNCRSLLLKFI
ncbi:LOW QUALITY PROTEIN: hypothetical protein KUTeg_002063 [Tegillarca granosa]|uniref:Uncharacterized protein n=1 Tax=Tegillarca granosa TaxID=220873 RepID=A0ABQ9FUP1_TEGGR|nr:LOW QUALITY PROTEIN: hypothetical protein KUTeg_002063 [Tegillarca granosa]